MNNEDVTEGMEDMKNLLMPIANWPNKTNVTNIDVNESEHAYFQPFDFGEFTSSEILYSEASVPNETASYPPGISANSTLKNPNFNDILLLEINCNKDDIDLVDSSFCDPNNIHFINEWENSDDLKQKCYRSQICANSILSRSLSSIESSKFGQKQRKQDLEDYYFYDSLQLFNICAAMIFYIAIIIYMSVYKTKNV
jgi:hypothetical protein